MSFNQALQRLSNRPPHKKLLTVSFTGPANSGKSSLLYLLLDRRHPQGIGMQGSDHTNTAIPYGPFELNRFLKNYDLDPIADDPLVLFIDTPGFGGNTSTPEKLSMTQKTLAISDLILFMYMGELSPYLAKIFVELVTPIQKELEIIRIMNSTSIELFPNVKQAALQQERENDNPINAIRMNDFLAFPQFDRNNRLIWEQSNEFIEQTKEPIRKILSCLVEKSRETTFTVHDFLGLFKLSNDEFENIKLQGLLELQGTCNKLFEEAKRCSADHNSRLEAYYKDEMNNNLFKFEGADINANVRAVQNSFWLAIQNNNRSLNDIISYFKSIVNQIIQSSISQKINELNQQMFQRRAAAIQSQYLNVQKQFETLTKAKNKKEFNKLIKNLPTICSEMGEEIKVLPSSFGNLRSDVENIKAKVNELIKLMKKQNFLKGLKWIGIIGLSILAVGGIVLLVVMSGGTALAVAPIAATAIEAAEGTTAAVVATEATISSGAIAALSTATVSSGLLAVTIVSEGSK